MKIIEKQGDLFTTDAYHIGHGVNTQGLMGAGVAKIVREKFPNVYERYRAQCASLGGRGMQPGEAWTYLSTWPGTNRGVWVHNLTTQDLPGPHARLDWVVQSVRRALELVEDSGASKLALPRLGCGIGGLDWDAVRPALDVLSMAFPDVELEVWYL